MPLDGDVESIVLPVQTLSPVVMNGYGFGQVGRNDGLAGVIPQHVVKRGGNHDPLCATVPLAPTTRTKKSKGTRARHGLRA